ncbi:uncharacterized protein LOC124777458 isoform X4 [Schistocerca piceifrons]|uniref:uncharacterized protein LOC124777458 isoform X4 n=1 Tax=Schistocerca piceifrons TaxID=274613 RepID=UPI001F5F03B7|nr:uncharacterized protein LOC124777458 isoform X4 [Schistocerca piceifrons]
MYERNIKMKLYKKVITATKKIKMIHISQKQGGRNEINLESDQCILSQKQTSASQHMRMISLNQAVAVTPTREKSDYLVPPPRNLNMPTCSADDEKT